MTAAADIILIHFFQDCHSLPMTARLKTKAERATGLWNYWYAHFKWWPNDVPPDTLVVHASICGTSIVELRTWTRESLEKSDLGEVWDEDEMVLPASYSMLFFAGRRLGFSWTTWPEGFGDDELNEVKRAEGAKLARLRAAEKATVEMRADALRTDLAVKFE